MAAVERAPHGRGAGWQAGGVVNAVLVRAAALRVNLGGRSILDGVDLEVRAGEICALVGPNGGGKTTLIRSLAGLLTPSSGSVTWYDDGTAATRPPFAIGYVPQRPTADFRYPVTVRDVVGMPLFGGPALKPRLGATERTQVDAALARMSVGHLADRPIGRLSGGQQQRVLIARALVVSPRLLLLDEPTTGIDAPGQEEMIALLVDLRDRNGVGIVLSTHHPGEAVAAIDRGFLVDRTVCEVAPTQLEQAHEWEAHGRGAHERAGGR
jgi:manganese/iron transport system ATP-binding protein